MEAKGSTETVRKKRVKTAAAALAEIAMFTALMAVGARISIPFYPVALTFQTVIAVLSGILLGAKKGAAAMLVYAFIGLTGLPVFTGGGGIFYVVKPSFGYILGFIASAVVGGLICNKPTFSLRRGMIAALCAMAADYLIGILYFIAVWQLSGYAGLGMAILTYNVLYIPKDLFLCLLAVIPAKRLAPAVRA